VLGPPGADETDGDPLDSARRDATGYLSHLTHPATRHVLFAVNHRWTAVVNNEREGSDFADSQWWFGRLCGARSCRVVDDEGQVRRVRGYRVRDSFPARIFELAESDGSTVRSVHCTLDGDRWDFGTSGSPLPAESAFAYSARRKRDRFTSENLQTFLCSLGVVPTVHHAFETADRFVLLAERLKDPLWAADVEAESCTPAQADDAGYGYFRRGLTWVPHMASHAESVVWDMTRAVLLSPDLESEARPYLDAARKQLGRAQFERSSAEVAEHLRRTGG
jgi:hypothetical protein